MPVYFIHGFRWVRQQVRIHVIINRIDDASPDWVIASKTQALLKESFATKFPDACALLPNLRFLEEYHPTQSYHAAEHAYVADTVIEIKHSVDVDQVRREHALSDQTWSAITHIRDNLDGALEMGWYIISCADEERLVGDDGAVEKQDQSARSSGDQTPVSPTTANTRERTTSVSRGFRKFFSRDKSLKKTTSLHDLQQPQAMSSSHSTITARTSQGSSSPPMPPVPAQYRAGIATLAHRQAGAGTQEGAAAAPSIGVAR